MFTFVGISMQKVGILNYGMGNLESLVNTVHKLGFDSMLLEKSTDFINIDFLILPGVGHFGKAMELLKYKQLLSPLHDIFLEEKIPILGICLGMQLFAKGSEEGGVEGLGWLDADIKRLEPQDTTIFKIPHIGWNTVNWKQRDYFSNSDEFYFVHSYAMVCNNDQNILGSTLYESEFVSACQIRKSIGFQFHPEKSHNQGLELMKKSIRL